MIILFAGPSLPAEPLPPGFDLRPPAVAGDLLRAAAARPAAIALVDGRFETAPSVGHKEVLHILGEGIPVWGAASLGALRAAELDGFGMVGVGVIYEAYRDGRLTRDDAVMVPHAPAALGHRPLGVPLVDALATLAAAPLAPEARRRLARIAARLHFRDLSWPAILARYDRPDRAHVAEVLAACAFSQKQRDTAALIAALATPPPRPAPPDIPRTGYLQSLVRRSLSR